MLFLCRDQAAEALYPNGTRVLKDKGEPGDATPIGTKGLVLGSISHPEMGVGYFVEWDDKPGVPIFVVERKLNAIQH
jgi:hypothetical protein